MRSAVTFLAGVLLLACGGATTSTSSGTPGRACSPGAQHLTFTGAVAGSLACTGGVAECARTASGHGETAHLEGDVGRTGVVLEITVGGPPGHDYHGPAEYATGPEQTEPAASVRLTAGGVGPGDWRPQGGGVVAVTADDASGLQGSLDLQLLGYGGSVEHVAGTWSCAKA